MGWLWGLHANAVALRNLLDGDATNLGATTLVVKLRCYCMARSRLVLGPALLT